MFDLVRILFGYEPAKLRRVGVFLEASPILLSVERQDLVADRGKVLFRFRAGHVLVQVPYRNCSTGDRLSSSSTFPYFGSYSRSLIWLDRLRQYRRPATAY